MPSADPCPACALARLERPPPGGVVLRTAHFLVHGFDGPTPLEGWQVITSLRHARALYDLEADELAELGPLTQRVMRAQRAQLGAAHVYAFALGDILEHFHLHLVPRFDATPHRLRGRGAFDSHPGDAVPLERVEAAAGKLRRALAGA